MTARIAFQGEPGAYSYEACRKARPQMEPLPCRSFEDVISAVRGGEAELAMLPVENTTYGRVADIHSMLPGSGLHIIDEAFVRVQIALMARPGVTLTDVRHVRAHPVLIPQARGFLRDHGITGEGAADSAGAAAQLAQAEGSCDGVMASAAAAEIYGLDILAQGIEDQDTNTTRFLIMSRDADRTRRGDKGMLTSFVFQVRNIPAALYKAMGGFATNGINMTKLESYMVGGSFTATQFYADIEGHPDDAAVARALDELDYFTTNVTILGVYPAAAQRH
ncbi:MAG: prephenate dehydratase [Marinibacterium sp.]|nr:prephenate dehydratase [Marinibacterium sp.]